VGVANRVRIEGDRVIREARTAVDAADLAKEARVIPAARAAGVRAPLVVSFDGRRMVQARLPGVDLSVTRATPGVLRELGAQLRLLHVHAVRPPGVPENDQGDPHAVVAGLARRKLIDLGATAWLDGWLDRLAFDPVPSVLVHGDVAPQNVLAADGAFTGLVDWGDAAWADPATDFAKMPPAEVTPMLQGYGEAIEARVLWYHLSWALARLADPVPNPGEHWTAPPYSRLMGLLRFFASGPPEPWNRLV
jgi:aminoglycoside phosphotransferase (APT) family kinase protein